MQRLLFLFYAFIISSGQAQGLEKVLIEKYYIADQQDALVSGGRLPEGSVTYRIFIDMKPGYSFQANFGIPGHPLIISTSTTFYNHPMYGGLIPNTIPDQVLVKDLVMLDSWISAGGASESNWGIPKVSDDTVSTITNQDKVLKNRTRSSGRPISSYDGLIAGAIPKVTGFGIDSLEHMFGKKSISDPLRYFNSENSSWACMGGAKGLNEDNVILIAQFTTNGDLTFEFNLQLGTPDGGVEQYVARDARDGEIQFNALKFSSQIN